ncbi:low molecular weight phosphatase family protein [Nesterenkonia sp. CL21]|uniref:arsenate reductase/protein-tyrosine-phosphatase family protein n=1 Tax=Nesterenkonia sp. CL21 TaxID=3064894 RepID=UPI00287A0133|nr:low molecular weight phosphatase family protein [Nesterenkonia sp. CL21]MDS2172030.1 low molecular weight phosphatase family protein [Nesterenkonia sp. CL21]
MTQDFTVLTVCTGNICRSPAMERLFVQVFADAAEEGLRVHSGGTYAHDGEDMQPPMKQRVADYGADADDFTARQVTAAMVEEADLILTATREHLEDVTAEVPGARARAFTVREVGRLAEHLGRDAVRAQLRDVVGEGATQRDRIAAVVPLLDRARQDAGRPGPDDDVVDPYMLPEDVYDESFQQIIGPIEVLAEVIRR